MRTDGFPAETAAKAHAALLATDPAQYDACVQCAYWVQSTVLRDTLAPAAEVLFSLATWADDTKTRCALAVAVVAAPVLMWGVVDARVWLAALAFIAMRHPRVSSTAATAHYKLALAASTRRVS